MIRSESDSLAAHTKRWAHLEIKMVLNLENNLLSKHVPCLLCPDSLLELEESCKTKRFGAKVISNKGMDLTVAVGFQIKRFIAAGKV